jgi:integrase
MYPDMIPYFAVGFFAGLRPEEIKRLAWVDVKEGFIEVQAAKSKTRQRRLVTIEGNLEKWLDRGGNLPPTRPLLKRRLIIKQCGVQWHHDGMRHTYASNHLAYYENPNKTAHELGHRDTNMLYRHYRELVSNAVASDYWSISPKDCR